MNADEITPVRKRGAIALAAWSDGELSDLEALRFLVLNLGEVESDLEPLTLERTYLRDAISQIVARLPQQKAEVAGFGALAITGGGESVTWDTKQLDGVVAKLLASGYPDFAEMIAMARKTSQRAASLRVTREKAK